MPIGDSTCPTTHIMVTLLNYDTHCIIFCTYLTKIIVCLREREREIGKTIDVGKNKLKLKKSNEYYNMSMHIANWMMQKLSLHL